MSSTEMKLTTSRSRTDPGKRQKPSRVFVDVELSGASVISFEMSATLTVARSPTGDEAAALKGATLSLPSRMVSRNAHCLVQPLSDGQLLVTDRGSTNGTLVNGRSVNGRTTVSTPCTVEVTPFTLVLRRERDDAPTEALRPLASSEQAALVLDRKLDAIRLYDGREVLGFTPIQHQILTLLIERFPGAIGAGELARVVSSTGSHQALYTQISEIRARLDEADPGARHLIRNRRSFGYSVAPAPADG